MIYPLLTHKAAYQQLGIGEVRWNTILKKTDSEGNAILDQVKLKGKHRTKISQKDLDEFKKKIIL